MIVSLRDDADAQAVKRELTALGLWIAATERSIGDSGVQFVVAAHSTNVNPESVAQIVGVRSVSVPVPEHPRIDRQGPVVSVAGHDIGGLRPTLMCGPCSVESPEQIDAIAARIAPLGVTFLR